MGLTLPVSDFVQVSVNAAPAAVAAKSFNQGLILGPSVHITSAIRLQQFASLLAVGAGGFAITDPEYIAAGIYFSQSPTPNYVWIGRQDLTAIQTLIPHAAAGGTGYLVGDVITITQGGAVGGKATVTTIGGGGVVTGLAANILGSQGTGYSVAAGLATTGGSGTALEVDITVIGETYAQAVQACALVNQQWYPFMACNATDADDTALAALSTANWQNYMYVGTVSDATIPAGTAGNIALAQQALKSRALLTYDTTQGGTFPNNAYAAAMVLGLICGLNSGLGGSAFTLNLKPAVGVAPEPSTSLSQNGWLNLQLANCNTVATWGAYIGYFASGVLSSGEFLDQILFRAMLINFLQTGMMNLLISVPKVPQTDAGEHSLISVAEQACQAMQGIGYIGGGVWPGAALVNPFNPAQVWIAPGQALPNGFQVFAPSYQYQSLANKAARQAMPIYIALIEAGAVHGVVIQVNTQL